MTTPNGSGKLSTNYYTTNLLHRYFPLPPIYHFCLLLLQHLLFSPLSTLPLNMKFIRFSNCPNKQSDSDPIPTWLFKECAYLLVRTITSIVNQSAISGQFHHILTECVISPLIKKSTLDKDQLSNYRPISNRSLISKITEHVVKSHLTDHLTSNKLLNPYQSAYYKHHSTETAHQCNRIRKVMSVSSRPFCCV